jgi:hypothetical protein
MFVVRVTFEVIEDDKSVSETLEAKFSGHNFTGVVYDNLMRLKRKIQKVAFAKLVGADSIKVEKP